MLADAITALQSEFAPLLAGEPPADAWLALAAAYGEQLGNLSNAAGHLGLHSLQQVRGVVQLNVLAWSAQPSASGENAGGDAAAVRAALRAWAGLALAWLSDPNGAPMAQALADVAADPAWPFPVGQELTSRWAAGLCGVPVMQTSVTSSLPRQALAEHVDLSIPPDIDARVLDSLLVELPQHARDLSGLLQGLGPTISTEQLAQAQRVAHTLKGAGHTVGIRGLANLTHALEEVLSALGREPLAGTPELLAALAQAADCLEEMGEALLQAGAAPPASLSTYQTLLDWVHRLNAPAAHADARSQAPPAEPDVGGAAEVHGPIVTARAPAPPLADAVEAATTIDTTSDTVNTWLRLPASQVDTLLALAVEDSIQASRLNDRVARLEQDLQLQRNSSRQWRLLAAELEQRVDVQGLGLPGNPGGRLDPLEMDQYGELHILSRRIVEVAQDSQTFVAGFGHELSQLRELLAASERIQTDLRRLVEHTRMVEVASVAPRLQRTVRQAARILGKPVQLLIDGEATLIDGQLLQALLDPLMHLLRNAVDHGIESAGQRQLAGKPAQGTITLAFRVDGPRLDIRCADDGAGLSLQALRAAAAAQGLLAEDQLLTDAQAEQLILQPGFSTRQQATLISGRGIGMDVVTRTVESLRGTLSLDAGPGRGLTVSLSMPTRMSMAKVLLSRSANHVLAISERGIQELLPLSEALSARADGQLQYRLHEGPVAAWRLEQLLRLPPMALRLAGRSEAVLIVQDHRGTRHAVLVPDIHESRQVFVKTTGILSDTAAGVDGITILGDGSIAGVIDLPDLLRAHLRDEQPQALPAAAMPAVRPTLCLVVDDSVSVRNTTAQLLQDTGYDVLCARDGVEALDLLHNCTPDIVLADLEMPRMNGLELTRAIRSRAQTRRTPVLMITSRFTARHQALARSAGVSAFMAKPFAGDELLQGMAGLLTQPPPHDEPASIMPGWKNDSNPVSPLPQ